MIKKIFFFVIGPAFLFCALLYSCTNENLKLHPMPSKFSNLKCLYRWHKYFLYEKEKVEALNFKAFMSVLSPDGRLIVATLFPDQSKIELRAGDGSKKTIITEVPASRISWTSDGNKLFYFGPDIQISDSPDAETRFNLYKDSGPHVGYLYDLETETHEKILTTQLGALYSFKFSKNNQYLAFNGVGASDFKKGFIVFDIVSSNYQHHLDGYAVDVIDWLDSDNVLLTVTQYPQNLKSNLLGWRQRLADRGYFWHKRIAKTMIVKYDIKTKSMTKIKDMPYAVIGGESLSNGYMCFDRYVLENGTFTPKLFVLDLQSLDEIPITSTDESGKLYQITGNMQGCLI